MVVFDKSAEKCVAVDAEPPQPITKTVPCFCQVLYKISTTLISSFDWEKKSVELEISEK